VRRSPPLGVAVSSVLDGAWDIRKVPVVPGSDDVGLANGAVALDAVVLYADLAGSTELARTFPIAMAAKVVRAFISATARLIDEAGGEVRGFDGDRVMGIFVGRNKNSAAAMCALRINDAVTNVLRPQAEKRFPSLEQRSFTIAHCTGIHGGHVLAVRGGVRGRDDLVFVGEAPNIAAELSRVRSSPYHSYVTEAVYELLHHSTKLGGSPKRDLWEPVTLTLGREEWSCYRSRWWTR
jgi:adenylate cyclase